MLEDQKYRVKVSIISTLDFVDYKDILDAIEKLGYKVTLVDNGNAVCEKKQGAE